METIEQMVNFALNGGDLHISPAKSQASDTTIPDYLGDEVTPIKHEEHFEMDQSGVEDEDLDATMIIESSKDPVDKQESCADVDGLDLGYPAQSYWRYYSREHRAIPSAQCRLCGKSIKMGQKASTGGLMRHLMMLHRAHFECMQKYKSDTGKMMKMPFGHRLDKGKGRVEKEREETTPPTKQRDGRKSKAPKELKIVKDEEEKGEHHHKQLEGQQMVANNVPLKQSPPTETFDAQLAANIQKSLDMILATKSQMQKEKEEEGGGGGGGVMRLLKIAAAAAANSKMAKKRNEIAAASSSSASFTAPPPQSTSINSKSNLANSKQQNNNFPHTKPNNNKMVAAKNRPNINTGRMPTSEIVARLGNARTKLAEALAEIGSLESELKQRAGGVGGHVYSD